MPVVNCRTCGREFIVPEGEVNPGGLCPACQNVSTVQPTQHQPEATHTAPASAAPVPAPLSPPGYEILSELGRGGMGVVYKAKQTALNRIVALKVILVGAHASADERARFRTEAETVARLHHPNIVQIHDLGESTVPGTNAPTPYLALEFCGGGNLYHRLKGGPLPPRLAAGLVEALAHAVQHAHERHVIHRDLKPANVLFDDKGVPKLADFGLAKKLDEQGHTKTGTVMGTPSYLAPEQAAGKVREMGPPTDVYALGAILYECLTGRPPFKGETALDTIFSVVSDPVPELPQAIPLPLHVICRRCLQKKPQERYPTAQALADDLRRYLGGQRVASFVAPVPAEKPSAKTGWLLGGLAALVLTAVAVLGAWMLRDGAKKREQPQGKDFEPAFRLPDRVGEVRQQKVSEKGINRVTFHPDGKRVAVADSAGFVSVWDLQGSEWSAKKISSQPLSSVTFNRDGTRLLTADYDQIAELWDLDNLSQPGEVQPLRRFSSRPPAGVVPLQSALFRSGDSEVLTFRCDGAICRWDVITGKRVGELTFAGKKRFFCDAALRPGADQVAVTFQANPPDFELILADVGKDRKVRSYALKPEIQIEGEGHTPVCCAFTADGLQIVSGERNGRVRLWQTDTGELRYTFDGHRGKKVTALTTSPRGRRALSAGEDGKIRLYDLGRAAQAEVFDAGDRPVSSLSFSPDGRHFASGGDDGIVRIWGVPPAKRE